MSIRPKHLEHAAEGFKLGWIGTASPSDRLSPLTTRLTADDMPIRHPRTLRAVQAGATFADDSRTQMTGSWFLLREESLEKARARLAQDVYATDGAWDMSRVSGTVIGRCTAGWYAEQRIFSDRQRSLQ